jgi:hypothetical protein
MFLSVDDGQSWTYSSSTSQGAPLTFVTLMVGALESPSAPPSGVAVNVFLALIVGAPRSTAPAPPEGPAIDVCYVDDGRFRISVSTFQGACLRRFLALMVGAIGSLALAPPRGPL